MDGPGGPEVERLIQNAIEEDLGPADLTTESTIPEEARGKGLFRAKQECVLAGLFLLPKIFSVLDRQVQVGYLHNDGDRVQSGTVVAEAEGNLRALLIAERTALNFLQRLSGIATLTRRYVDAVKEFPCKIIDTRKTAPGLRALEKYAVRMGGGTNHRFGLYDAALIKDNHIAACESIAQAIQRVRGQAPFMARIEVECGNLRQVDEAVKAAADVIMLDNMGAKEMAEAVRLINRRAWVEASGGIRIETVREVAAAGVDFISVGALTHSAPAVDISMKIAPPNKKDG